VSAGTGAMRVGVHLGNYSTGNDGKRVLEIGVNADRLGFDSVWVSDHVVVPSVMESIYPYSNLGKSFTPDSAELFYEAIVTLSVLAGCTTNVTLGTSVLVIPQRNPLVVAKQLSTLDDLCGGRLHVGVGAGWLKEEYEALAAPFATRWTALEEFIAIFRELWTERDASYSGSTYSFGPVRMAPKPSAVGGPPITIGGHSARVLRIAGSCAQGLHGFRLSPEASRESLEEMQRHAEKAGRSPEDVTVVLRMNADHPDSMKAADAEVWRFVGTADEVASKIALYAEAGVTELLLSMSEGRAASEADETMAWMAEEVLPLIR
jgi:probable F420-dependent oxidoreductase